MDKELYIIRHGETELNRLGIVQGRGIDADLNDTGRAQAKAFFDTYKNVPFDKVYTSTLKRTHQTVQAFIDAGIPWQQLSGLDELAWGEWEGQPNTEEAREVFRQLVEEWLNGNYDARLKGGESPQEVAGRLQEALQTIAAAAEEKTVLVCMHGRALRILLCLLSGKPLNQMAEFAHANTILYRVSLSGGKYDIIDPNNSDHLQLLTP
ncbi:histidine phosphatase family protein [Pedobacter yulinensis]|uniref:phosphoglycerate mutase (2,3-diphosphoglycerate-dependent) n=1 Tax=Pedobacter yulinensis TaxID=2126353 RepID=A0A2T3HLC0_9SPHI|nr:histidine phosphatase family protein [Pedobacter yulinensis]PST83224.1 histidine phosphatase family protein [Pedobacter yulinensis]